MTKKSKFVGYWRLIQRISAVSQPTIVDKQEVHSESWLRQKYSSWSFASKAKN